MQPEGRIEQDSDARKVCRDRPGALVRARRWLPTVEASFAAVPRGVRLVGPDPSPCIVRPSRPAGVAATVSSGGLVLREASVGGRRMHPERTRTTTIRPARQAAPGTSHRERDVRSGRWRSTVACSEDLVWLCSLLSIFYARHPQDPGCCASIGLRSARPRGCVLSLWFLELFAGAPCGRLVRSPFCFPPQANPPYPGYGRLD